MVSRYMSLAAVGEGQTAMLGWVLLGLIVVAFLAFGLRDLARLSLVRISAIASVSFAESIRRRVLWITPLAILGAIVVSQLQNAVDPQDAIRQTTKICIFATGLIVTLVAIILASTNLPKEIESRVIYTIVTKPTTRLEIVLGKIWGFAKVSATILLIMGVFTYAYLQVRAWRLGSSVSETLRTLPADALNRPTLEYYQQAGLLNAKAMTLPSSLELLSRVPEEGQPRWMAGGQGQRFALPFQFSPNDYPAVEEAIKTGGRVSLIVNLPVTVREPTPLELETIQQSRIPTEDEGAATRPTTAPATLPSTATKTTRPVPLLTVTVESTRGELLPAADVNEGENVKLPVPSGPVEIPLSPAALDRMFGEGAFVVKVQAISPAVEYAVGNKPLVLQVINADNSPGLTFEPRADSLSPAVVGTFGRYGQQLFGGPENFGGVAVYHFDDATAVAKASDEVTFEIKTAIERSGDSEGDVEVLPVAELRIRNLQTGVVSTAYPFRPENNRINYVNVPRGAFPAEGKFDVLVRVLTPGQWLGVQPDSVALATASRSFAFNLVKSLLILWLMSILVASIAVFCSTFVSWPIAVVLTLVLLLGRWGVEQIGDVGGMGSMMTGQTEDAAKARLARNMIDSLGKVLTVVSAFLPDISSFEATTDIERGISVPISRFTRPGVVLLGYGVPMVILAYLVLKRKEVAP